MRVRNSRITLALHPGYELARAAACGAHSANDCSVLGSLSAGPAALTGAGPALRRPPELGKACDRHRSPHR
jgi:hypothetical protein